MKNCTMFSAGSVSLLYVFIIDAKYEEKKCIIVKFVLNCIIISYRHREGTALPSERVPFPIIPSFKCEKIEIDVDNPGRLW